MDHSDGLFNWVGFFQVSLGQANATVVVGGGPDGGGLDPCFVLGNSKAQVGGKIANHLLGGFEDLLWVTNESVLEGTIHAA